MNEKHIHPFIKNVIFVKRIEIRINFVNKNKSMRLPKKITPDNLKDTLVEIRYAKDIVPELLPGLALGILKPMGFAYIPASNSNINILDNNQQIAFGIGAGNAGFFVKEHVRIHFNPNQIVFNCISDKYVGWEAYFEIITKVTGSLFDNGIIQSFSQLSIRYISEFKHIDIYQAIKGTIDVSNTGLKLDNSILRLTDESGNLKIFVTLTNKAKRISASLQGQQIIEASLIDINIYENFNPISDFDALKTKLNEVHLKQKEVFFGLINDEFLETLKPEY